MSRLINADSYLKNFCNRFCSVKECTSTQKKSCCIAISLEEEPTAKAVPVVHCKDCKQWGCGLPMETDQVKCCSYGGYMVGKEGYCVYGQKA